MVCLCGSHDSTSFSSTAKSRPEDWSLFQQLVLFIGGENKYVRQQLPNYKKILEDALRYIHFFFLMVEV